MQFDTKIAIAVRDDLAPWQKLNVTAFLSGGLAGANPHLIGEAYVDASQCRYLPLIRQPILIYAASAAALHRALQRARARGVPVAIYTADLFATTHDAANRAAVASVPTTALDLVGLIAHADRKSVDKVMDGLHFHP